MKNKDLASSVYQNLRENNVQFNENKDDINLLNGAVITSGQDFFKSLGMKFKDTEVINESGKNEGKPVQCCDIKSKEDIPEKVIEFFKESNQFLCDLVGKENVINSVIHFDENTPHLHFYFVPVVDKVYKKVFEKDENGNRLLKETINKNGEKKLVPVLKKDENGKNVYNIEEGKFLNSDQFWKDKGGKSSFAIIQDKYHEYITSKGYNLDRGEVGAHKQHKTTLQHQIEELELKKARLENEIDFAEIDKESKEKLDKIDTLTVLNPTKKTFGGYVEYDIQRLKQYSSELKIQNISKDNTIDKQYLKIKSLENQLHKLKNYDLVKDKDSIIKQQKVIINKQEDEIKNLKSLYETVTKKLKETVDFMNTMFQKFIKAIEYLVGNKSPRDDIDINVYKYKIDNIINHFEKENKHLNDKNHDSRDNR